MNITVPEFTGDTGTGGAEGLVPAPAAGDAAAGKYLHADGTWKQVVMAGVAIRTGSAIAPDQPAVYNSPTAPSSGTVTMDLSGAVAGTEVVAFFNHSSEPTWPAGVTSVGVWNNSALNVVRFLYQDASNIIAVINSNAAGSYTNPETIKLVTSNVATTGTTATAIPALSFTALAGRTYVVDINLKITGTSSGGVVFGLYSVETDATCALRGTSASSSSTARQYMLMEKGIAGFNALTTTFVAANSASNSSWMRVAGTITGGAADSVVDLRFASAKSGQSANIYKAGSFMKVTLT